MTLGLSAVGISGRLELAFLALKKSATDAIRDDSGKKINYYMDDQKRAIVWKRIRDAPQDIEYALMFHRREAELFGLMGEAAGNGDRDAAAGYLRKICGNIRGYTERVEVHQTLQEESFLGHLSYMDWRNFGMVSLNIFGTKEGVLEEIDAIEAGIGALECEAIVADKYGRIYRNEIYCLERQLENHGFAI